MASKLVWTYLTWDHSRNVWIIPSLEHRTNRTPSLELDRGYDEYTKWVDLLMPNGAIARVHESWVNQFHA